MARTINIVCNQCGASLTNTYLRIFVFQNGEVSVDLDFCSKLHARQYFVDQPDM